jgi:3'-5' exoribonuclease
VSGKTTFVKDLVPGRAVDDLFLVADARSGQAKNGPFWTLALEDATGAVEARVWSPVSQLYADIRPGSLVRVEGMAGSYRDKTQISVDRLEFLPPEALAPLLPLFTASSAVPPAALLEDLEALCRDNIRHAPWRRFTRKVLTDPEVRDRLVAAPGAKSVHHAYVGGLLEHTLSVCGLVLAIGGRYPALDMDTLLPAAAFHDLGKAWELTAGLPRDYTDPGRLLGHIVLGLDVLEPFFRKAKDLDPALVLHFKHIMVSHHGEYEFGSPKRPKTPEAFVLHFADNIDAKLNQTLGAFADDDPEASWSPYVRTLERFLYNPRRVARQDEAKKTEDKGTIQCSLPLKA